MRVSGFSDELRLAWIIVLNGAVLAGAWRFARRFGASGAVQAGCDMLLLWFLVQYAAVALPGVAGIFSGWSLTAVALGAAGLLWFSAGSLRVRQLESVVGAPRPTQLPARYTGGPPMPWVSRDHLGLIGCAAFTCAYLAAYAYTQRYIPPVATDALVYHLPTSVQWIQTGWLGIYPTWYWNPAASYSPATASTFMAWWMAPAGNDVLVRFVQLPALVLVFLVVARICRIMGCGRTLAGLIATAATLSRPLFSEAIIPKDDLYVTGFVAAAALALGSLHTCDDQRPPTNLLDPWRVGIALGFVLASKYTALLACPIFLFLADTPFRARWRARHYLIAIGLILVLAAPWYVRNAVLTGNPLYPVDVNVAGIHWRGLFGTERDSQLRRAAGIWKMLSETYNSLPPAIIALLILGWIGAWLAGGRAIVRDPLPRVCALGSVLTLALFLGTSPHHEVRYIFPLIVLWFAAIGLALSRGVRRRWIQLSLAGVLALLSAATTFSALSFSQRAFHFSTTLGGVVAALMGVAAVAGGIGVGAAFVISHWQLSRRIVGAVVAICMAGLALATYVDWHAYVDSYRDVRMLVWNRPENAYPRQAPLWAFVDEHVPPDATVAYANTFFVYPYYGFHFTRHIGYAPTRRGLHDFRHFPRMGDRVPGDLIVNAMTATMNADPDLHTWMDNLRNMHAQYLVVARRDLVSDPPELRLTRQNPRRFMKVYEDALGVVYSVSRQ